MQLAEGAIMEGKVSGIKKFGAFVDLGDGVSGLVHISEISEDYVDSVEDYLKIDQKVKVRVISVEEGKISLSMKGLGEEKKKVAEWSYDDGQSEMSFEDKISRFMKDSNEKYAQLRMRDNKRFSVKRK